LNPVEIVLKVIHFPVDYKQTPVQVGLVLIIKFRALSDGWNSVCDHKTSHKTATHILLFAVALVEVWNLVGQLGLGYSTLWSDLFARTRSPL
jgi:hypothetical protein